MFRFKVKRYRKHSRTHVRMAQHREQFTKYTGSVVHQLWQEPIRGLFTASYSELGTRILTIIHLEDCPVSAVDE